MTSVTLHTIALPRMQSGVSGCLPKGRRKRAAMMVGVIAAGLLACDMMVHLTSGLGSRDNVKEGSFVTHTKERHRRSVGSSAVQNQTPTPKGAVYVRWGRSDCPGSAVLLYKGVVGSGHNGHKGGGSDYLCLTDEPQWISTSSASKYGYMYGVEYQPNRMGIATNQNAVCAACQSTRANKLMIPGRTSCITGWIREYYGYLMGSEYKEEGNHNFICVDYNPVADRAGYQSEGGAKLYHVHTSCGALPCPKYVSGRMMTCVMCTR